MKGHLLMSKKERRSKSVFDRVQSGQLSIREGSEVLGLSYRQCRRSYKRFVEEGDGGLVHRSRGRPSNRGKAPGLRRKVLARYEQRYAPYATGPTLASEKLAEEGLVVDHETLRRWLLAEGLWHKRRKKRTHRRRRERKAHFGELVQMDGSHHRWFGPERPECCLMEMVDDATGQTLSLMAPAETTEAAMRLLWQWVERHGIPKALYTDKKNVFVTDREPTLEEQLAGQEPMTAFGKACYKLGIEIITAHSPQAKGRVERKHGVHQDRLVKELALRGITTFETTNRVLNNGFTANLNAKFARPPLSEVNFHRPVPQGLNLADVFCFEQFRTVQNDWTVRYQNRHYQILEDNRPLPKPKDKVLVRVRLDNSIHLIYRGKPLAFRPICAAELRKRLAKETPGPQPQPQVSPRRVPYKPAPDHPWRKAALPRPPHKHRF